MKQELLRVGILSMNLDLLRTERVYWKAKEGAQDILAMLDDLIAATRAKLGDAL